MTVVPLPAPGQARLTPPDAAEVEAISRGMVGAVRPAGGLTEIQRLLLQALVRAMTGFPAGVDGAELGPAELGRALAPRSIEFRTRIVQMMILLGLVLRPLPEEVADRIATYAATLGVEEGMLQVAHRFSEGSLGLAAFDFERNGYAAT